MRRRKTILDNVTMLAAIGVIAGALGGLAIGVMTGRSPSAASSSSTSH